MKLVIYTDGASRGNPGHAAYGFTISDERGRLLYEEGRYIGKTTNNVAEYTAVLESLKHVKKEFLSQRPHVQLFVDSKLVAEQLSGRYKIKSPHLKPIIQKIQVLAIELGGMTFSHVPRSLNILADRLANQALDKR